MQPTVLLNSTYGAWQEVPDLKEIMPAGRWKSWRRGMAGGRIPEDVALIREKGGLYRPYFENRATNVRCGCNFTRAVSELLLA